MKQALCSALMMLVSLFDPAIAEGAPAGKPAIAWSADPSGAPRILTLQGGVNFRDIGGYRTEDGHSVKWGKAFRSGSLTHLTDSDYAFVKNLGIQTVVDFRSTEERQSEPTAWRAGSPVIFTKDYSSAADNAGFAKALQSPGLTPETMAQVMIGFYRDVPNRFADQYAVLFHKLAKGEGAVLFHCTAGKDRTGVAAGILLSALGVPRQTVLADYALSEKVVDYMGQMSKAPSKDGDAYAFLRKLPKEVVVPLMRSDPRYLEAALVRIDQEYGSVDGYLKTKLGLDAAEIAALKSRLLEPAH